MGQVLATFLWRPITASTTRPPDTGLAYGRPVLVNEDSTATHLGIRNNLSV
jgi:hypothetical protein